MERVGTTPITRQITKRIKKWVSNDLDTKLKKIEKQNFVNVQVSFNVSLVSLRDTWEMGRRTLHL